MRGKVVALLLLLGIVSAVSGTVAALSAIAGKGAQTCDASSPSSDDAEQEPTVQRATLSRGMRKLLP